MLPKRISISFVQRLVRWKWGPSSLHPIQRMLCELHGNGRIVIKGIMNLASTSDIVTRCSDYIWSDSQRLRAFHNLLAAASSNANTKVSMMGETLKYCAPIVVRLDFLQRIPQIPLVLWRMVESTLHGPVPLFVPSWITLLTRWRSPASSLGCDNWTSNPDGSMRSLTAIFADWRFAFGSSPNRRNHRMQNHASEECPVRLPCSYKLRTWNNSKIEGAIKNCDVTSEKIAETMQDNLSGQLTILKSLLQELVISFADLMIPELRSLVRPLQGMSK